MGLDPGTFRNGEYYGRVASIAQSPLIKTYHGKAQEVEVKSLLSNVPKQISKIFKDRWPMSDQIVLYFHSQSSSYVYTAPVGLSQCVLSI